MKSFMHSIAQLSIVVHKLNRKKRVFKEVGVGYCFCDPVVFLSEFTPG